ncbi:hypothetical protein GCM10025794_37250 [Massilia kyonggiensis]
MTESLDLEAVVYYGNFANVHDPQSPDIVPYFLFGQLSVSQSCDNRSNWSGAGQSE